MKIYENSVGLVCVGPKDPQGAIVKTVGTCVVFTYKEYMLISSCRHVIEPELSGLTIKTLLRVRDGDTSGTREVILGLTNTRNWRFHPRDTADSTHDIALFWFGHKTDQVDLLHLPDEIPSPHLKQGDSLLILGYPVADLSKEIVNDNSKPLPLRVLQASYIDFKGSDQPENYQRTVEHQEYAEVKSKEDLEGISGGLVLSVHDGAMSPVGIVTGSGNGTLRGPSETVEVNVVSFTPFNYLYDILHLLK